MSSGKLRFVVMLRLSLCFAFVAVACDDTVTYYRDVKPLVEQRCTRCHVAGGIAPFALTSYDDLASRAGVIKDAVVQRIMPPWLAAPGCTQYEHDISLSDAQIATIARWVDTGTIAGNPDGYEALPPLPAGGLKRTDVELKMPAAYQ